MQSCLLQFLVEFCCKLFQTGCLMANPTTIMIKNMDYWYNMYTGVIWAHGYQQHVAYCLLLATTLPPNNALLLALAELQWSKQTIVHGNKTGQCVWYCFHGNRQICHKECAVSTLKVLCSSLHERNAMLIIKRQLVVPSHTQQMYDCESVHVIISE